MARDDLHRLTGKTGGPDCDDDDCPNLYVDKSDGGIIVQGNLCSAFQPPAGEALVKIPEHVLKEAVRALGW
jgi:hypothetical protein